MDDIGMNREQLAQFNREIDNLFDEIESLQSEVERIFHHKRWIVRVFQFKRAVKLHLEAERKLDEVYHLLSGVYYNGD